MAISNRYSRPAHQTSASPTSDSTSTRKKKASGNSCKNFRAIQRSDQKLWPFQTVNLVWPDQTSASRSSDSTSTPQKTAYETLVKL